MKKIFGYLGMAAGGMLVVMTLYYLRVMSAEGPQGITFIEPEESYASFYDLIDHPDLKGKTIYVDFWHTGCHPCLEEFTYLPDFKNNFEEKDNLAFLYLGKDRSVPGEEFRWKKMVMDRRITGYHYFITDKQFYHFWDETVQNDSILQAFPHHLIVGVDGRVVNDNAPRASDPKTVEVLKKAL